MRLAPLLLITLTAACDKSASSSATPSEETTDREVEDILEHSGSSALVANSGESMPSCGAGNERQLIYIRDTGGWKYCDSGAWINIVVKGQKGDKGDAGERGARGEVGAQGERGLQGLQGLQGIQGSTGATGSTGQTGAAGSSCSAAQVTGGVQITCTNGTSGFLASAGNVIVFPAGSITGSSGSLVIPSGQIVWRDQNDVDICTLPSGSNNCLTSDAIFKLPNTRDILYPFMQTISYTTSDCSSQGFGNSQQKTDNRYLTYRKGTTWYVAANQTVTNLLIKSVFEFDTPNGRCATTESVVDTARPLVEFSLSNTMQNAVFPLELYQYPN